ncbi:MAG: molybdopterin cofactor-binding domain-containing protein, partial [Pseudomonadota bacterium]
MTIARLSALTEPSRRRFLTGAAGLVIGVALPLKTRAQSGAEAVLGAGAPGENAFVPNAFVRIASDDTVTVLIKHIEFGQGPWTGLATLVADELDADWAQIRAEHAPSDTAIYANILLGAQGTGGSTAMASSFDVMRKAGAAAREMLLSAAANAWGVQPAQLKIEKGIIQDTSSGRSGSFGEFADAASALPTPENPTLKTPDQFIFIDKNVPKLDTPGKSTGQAVFTLDVYKDGMQTVVVQHPDRFGATVASVDDVAARAVDGVTDVKSVSTG